MSWPHENGFIVWNLVSDPASGSFHPIDPNMRFEFRAQPNRYCHSAAFVSGVFRAIVLDPGLGFMWYTSKRENKVIMTCWCGIRCRRAGIVGQWGIEEVRAAVAYRDSLHLNKSKSMQMRPILHVWRIRFDSYFWRGWKLFLTPSLVDGIFKISFFTRFSEEIPENGTFSSKGIN